MKENELRDMVNELRLLCQMYYQFGLEKTKCDYGRMRTDIVKIVSKYIEVKNG